MNIQAYKKWQKIAVHILVWLVLLSFNIHVLANFFPLNSAIFRGTAFFSSLACIFYLNTHWLIPKFLDRKKYLWYAAIVLLLLVVVGFINKTYNMHFHPPEIPLRKIHPPADKSRFMVGSVVFVLLIGGALHFINNYKKAQQQKDLLMNQKTEAELQLLKAQVNPHFMFNTLNNIYSLSLKQSKQVPEMIMSLSEIMRYMIHEANPEFVPVEKEIAYLKSYIELEKLRCEYTDKVKIDFSPQNKKNHVAPLLFIPFVENAFKHSRIVDNKDAWIKIELAEVEGMLLFECVNSKPQQQFIKDKTGGIGLENVRKRLELIYPQKHKLFISRDNDEFKVKLELKV